MTSHEKRVSDGFWTIVALGALGIIGWIVWEIHTHYINLLVVGKALIFACVGFAVVLGVSYLVGVLINDVPENVRRWRE